MNRKRKIQLIVAVPLALMLASQGFGQQRSAGSILGTVTSIQGAPVVNARVLITCVASGQTFALRTSPDGSFEVANLPDGIFSVAIDAAGFNGTLRRNVRIRNGNQAELNEVLDQAGSSVAPPEDVESLKRRIDGLEAQNRELADQNR